MKYQK